MAASISRRTATTFVSGGVVGGLAPPRNSTPPPLWYSRAMSTRPAKHVGPVVCWVAFLRAQSLPTLAEEMSSLNVVDSQTVPHVWVPRRAAQWSLFELWRILIVARPRIERFFTQLRRKVLCAW